VIPLPPPTDAPVAPSTATPPTSAPPLPNSLTSLPYALKDSEENIAPSQEEYLDKLATNLETSDTSCEQVKQAMIQKTLAEEAVVASDLTYDEIMGLAADYNGNADVERIKAKAELSHMQVEAEAVKARVAADLASELCSQMQTRFRGRPVEESIQEEVEVAKAAVLESRLALADERSALDELEEVFALIEFDPTMTNLESTIKEDEEVLVNHLGSVETEIKNVDSQINEVPETSSPDASALEKKKDLLVEEEHQIENALMNQEHFLISESALKKDQFYESVSPDFGTSPPLQYILKYRKEGNKMTVISNWDEKGKDSNPKESWFRRFGDYLVADVPVWLVMAFNTTAGGCIPEDADLSIDIVITELKTMWEKLNQAQCSREADEEANEGHFPCPVSASGSASGPTPIGGRAIWSSHSQSTPYYREFDGSAFDTNTMQGAYSIKEYTYGHGASSPICYEHLFVGVTIDNEISGTRWDGSAWKTISIGADAEKLGSDSDNIWNSVVATYESESGRALIVLRNADQILYSIWDRKDGKWSDSTDVDPLYVGREPAWFDIASSPVSNEIVVVFTDSRPDIFVTVWDGLTSRWTPIIDLTDTTYHTAVAVSYESISGRAMLVYGGKKGNSGHNIQYCIWNGSTWEDQQVAFPLGDDLSAKWIVLRSDPSSNRLVVSAIIPRGCVLLSIWNGNEWEATEESSCKILDIESPSASVAIESKSGDALAVFGERGSSNVFYKTLTKGSTMWSNVMSAGDIQATPASIALYSNPDLESNQIMLMVMNVQKNLFVAQWDGSQFSSFTELETDVGQDAKMPFSFLWN